MGILYGTNLARIVVAIFLALALFAESAWGQNSAYGAHTGTKTSFLGVRDIVFLKFPRGDGRTFLEVLSLRRAKIWRSS